MKMQDFRNNTLVQSLVILLLVVSFLFAELTTYLVAGQVNVVLTQVFYIPVILLSFRLARRAVFVSVVLAVTYLVLVLLFSGSGFDNLAPAVMQFYVYISIGIVIGSLSAKIQVSEMKYRELFRQSGNAVCLADMKAETIFETNPKFGETFSLSGNESPGEIFRRVFSDRETAEEIRSRIARGEVVSDMDISVIPEKRPREDLILNATPLDMNGLTVITLADVSRLKREEERALAESEAKYRSLVELAQEGIWAIDSDGVTTYANPKLLEILGYQKSQLLEHTLFEFLGEKSWIGAPVENGQVGADTGREDEFEFIRNDGTRITASLSIAPITGSDGNFNGAIALVTDITDKKRAETAIKESEERFRGIFESQMTGTLLIDAGTHAIVDANERAVNLIGLGKNEILGRVCHTFICPTAIGNCPFTDIGQTVDQSEWVLLNAKGERIPIMKFVRPFVMGEKHYLIETFTDITELKKNEEHLKSALAEKSVLLMEVHHRVKNNLQIISGLIRLQSRYITNQQALGALQECENRVTTMALVHESLYQSGNLANINAKQHLTHLVTNLLMSETEERQIKLVTDIDNIQIDLNTAIPASLIVNELVTNAMKYAFKGRADGTIRISLHRGQDNMYDLIVRDNGVGIPEDIDPLKANSLGLKLVTRLVRDQLKGTMDIQREEGTAFVIRFPPMEPSGKKVPAGGSHAG
jgi:PAS domain S-box-containing protein